MANENSNNRLSLTLTTEQINGVAQSLDSIEQTLDFLLGLTPEDRKRLLYINASNKIFVEDALNALQQNPDVFPAYLNAEEIQKDLTLFEQLDSLFTRVSALHAKLKDTRSLAGDEAYRSALAIYRLVESANASGIAGMSAVYDALKTRFANQGTANNTETENQEE